MQHYSPVNGFPNGRTNLPYVPIPAPPVTPYPQIVGEGDVTSVALPDGSLQLYFVPAMAPASYFGNYQQCNVQPVAWFIRTIPNVFPASQPPALNPNLDTPPSSHALFQYRAEEKPVYQLQFHNDQTTSSTDMHYFCRPLHSFNRDQTQSVENNEHPVKLYEVVCCKRCHYHQSGKSECEQTGSSSMSIDGTIDESKFLCHCDTKANKVRFRSGIKTESNPEVKSKNKCKCEKRQTSEKSNQSVSERASQSTSEQASQSVNERASQLVNERASQSARDQQSQVQSCECGHSGTCH